MIGQRPVAVTGAHGRLGTALIDALGTRGIECIAWARPEYDLDDPAAAQRLVERDNPGTVIHCAAWTDVNACAREPEVANRRNGDAVGRLAAVCSAVDVRLVLVSTNEVFDGERTDGRGYTEFDVPRPINPYGSSKHAGEELTRAAFAAAGRSGSLWIIRTAWLYGPPGADFPAKIIAAADRLSASEPLRVVEDEVGSPTYTVDLAAAILDLIEKAPADVYHLANSGVASRYDVAQEVLGRCRPGRAIEPMGRADFRRASNAPAWAVLETSRAAGFGVTLRDWRSALAEYVDQLC